MPPSVDVGLVFFTTAMRFSTGALVGGLRGTESVSSVSEPGADPDRRLLADEPAADGLNAYVATAYNFKPASARLAPAHHPT